MSVVEPMIIEKKVVYFDLNGILMKIANFQMIIKNIKKIIIMDGIQISKGIKL